MNPATSAPAAAPAYDHRMVYRHRLSRLGRWIFLASTVVGIVVLSALLYNVIDQAFGLVAIEAKIAPTSLAVEGVPLEKLSRDQLTAILQTHVSKGLFRRLERDQPFAERTRDDVYGLVIDRVVEPTIVETWSLTASLLQRSEIQAAVAAKHPAAELSFRSWVNPAFVSAPQSSNPLIAGIRGAILGSLWIIGLTVLLGLPIGIGAAIYLEEYASDTWINRIIQTNINNLAGVPSIIYGILGLTIFVRFYQMERSILAGGLTLALMIIPMTVIAAQEAIRQVPPSLRDGALALGATRWQAVRHNVLPNAVPGIMTGVILSISRAAGETAALIMIGGFTFIRFDPGPPPLTLDSFLDAFTVLPIAIYGFTIDSRLEFQANAAAAIIVLMAGVLTLNLIAAVIRERFRRG